MKKLSLIAALVLVSSGASAQALSGGVDVQVTLTSQCRVKAGANPVIDFGTYVAFGAAKNLPAAATVTFECTRGFGGTPVAAWDTTNGTAAGGGVLAGLQYTLSVPTGARVGGTAATATVAGTPDEVRYSVNAAMPGGQAGDSAVPADSHTRTLLVTF